VFPDWIVVKPRKLAPGTIPGHGKTTPGPSKPLATHPALQGAYQTVLAGADIGTAILPDGRKISSQKALQDGAIKISGADDFDFNHLTLTGPAGTQINIDAPLGLSADPWLE
jgi:hypothetical protein